MTEKNSYSPETEQQFAEKAKTYVVCHSDSCPLREHCLRHLLLSYVPQDQYVVTCVNLSHPHMQREDCPYYVSTQPLRMPSGLKNVYRDMPRHIEVAVKKQLIGRYSRKRYYEYHNGTRPLSPDVEQYVRQALLAHGWPQEPQFDGYVEEFAW